MKIKFCGAAREVTGSAHLLTLDDDTQILLDCGLCQAATTMGGLATTARSADCENVIRSKEIKYLVFETMRTSTIPGVYPEWCATVFRAKYTSTHASRDLLRAAVDGQRQNTGIGHGALQPQGFDEPGTRAAVRNGRRKPDDGPGCQL